MRTNYTVRKNGRYLGTYNLDSAPIGCVRKLLELAESGKGCKMHWHGVLLTAVKIFEDAPAIDYSKWSD